MLFNMTIGEKMIKFCNLIIDKGFITISDMRDFVSDDVIALVESNYEVKADFVEVMEGVHIMVFVKDGKYVTNKDWVELIGGTYDI